MQRLLLKVLLDIAVEQGSSQCLAIGLLRERPAKCSSLSVGIQKPPLQ
jgi:hypothetical protein